MQITCSAQQMTQNQKKNNSKYALVILSKHHTNVVHGLISFILLRIPPSQVPFIIPISQIKKWKLREEKVS